MQSRRKYVNAKLLANASLTVYVAAMQTRERARIAKKKVRKTHVSASKDLAAQWGVRFKAVMAEKGATVESLVRADRFMRANTITRWMHGTRFPRPRNIVDIAKALNMSPMDLIRGLPVPPRVLVEIEASVSPAAAVPSSAA